MSTLRHGLDEDAVIAMSDGELIRRIFEWIGRLDDDVASDALYWLTGEAFERLAPEVEWAERVRYLREEAEMTPENVALELEASFLVRRRREGARLIRKAFEEDGDG